MPTNPPDSLRELLDCLRGLVIIAEYSLSVLPGEEEVSCAEIPREMMAEAKKLVRKVERRIARAQAAEKPAD